jgi:hypothetical protein
MLYPEGWSFFPYASSTKETNRVVSKNTFIFLAHRINFASFIETPGSSPDPDPLSKCGSKKYQQL